MHHKTLREIIYAKYIMTHTMCTTNVMIIFLLMFSCKVTIHWLFCNLGSDSNKTIWVHPHETTQKSIIQVWGFVLCWDCGQGQLFTPFYISFWSSPKLSIFPRIYCVADCPCVFPGVQIFIIMPFQQKLATLGPVLPGPHKVSGNSLTN